MDPISGLAASSRLQSFWLIREVTSVLIPGLALSVEVVALIAHRATLSVQLDPRDISGPIALACLVAGIAASWLVGYVSREFAFRILTLVTEPRPERAAAAIQAGRGGVVGRLPKVLQRQVREMRGPQLTAEQLLGQLRSEFGDDRVDAFLSEHPLLGAALGRSAGAPEDVLRGGGGHLRDPSTWVFGYCKRWLMRNSPITGVSPTEIEINMTAASVFPAALFPFALGAVIQGAAPAVLTVAGGVAVIAVYELTRSFRRLRGSERWDALQRTFEDSAMYSVESQRQATAAVRQDESGG